MKTKNTSIKKPIPLRIIFILNALMMILPFVFYYVFTTNNIQVGDLNPIWMVYTGIAYIISFVLLVFTILKRNSNAAKAIFLVNIMIAIPAGAYIGMLIAIVSLLLIFFNAKVKEYFGNNYN
ncbi:hypothetical protein RQM59_08175 [Flavobacteriaceae bacterium S356]|uniref:Uncharacterized protein n=1 Tax=Asprobacillus argus TaxID=3076534 RepID=A0ABU3LFH8_9FLAO|nr:hypothetical protein [Flavobacteriaceae bacterium S356]